MAKYQVKVVYGKPGESKNGNADITVEAESESTAMQLAINQIKNRSSADRNKEVDVVKVKKL